MSKSSPIVVQYSTKCFWTEKLVRAPFNCRYDMTNIESQVARNKRVISVVWLENVPLLYMYELALVTYGAWHIEYIKQIGPGLEF